MSEKQQNKPLIVVGLGNPGKKYEGTRHNIGWGVIDALYSKLENAPLTMLRHSTYCQIQLPHGQLVLVWPSTYMNLSGKAVIEILELFEATPDRLLIIVDDIAIPLGAIRTRPSGSDGGHNGLFSIVESIDTQSFARIRLGVGPVPEGVDSADFVLARFAKTEREIVEKIVPRAVEAVIFALDHPLAEVMSKFNCNPVSTG
ncbi:MAG: aminoacyl-tRNA hydrolase [Candidatus Zixiibacteriota bacterium]